MTETQRKCAAVLRQGLELKGWKALDDCTLVKNYCVFKMYDNNSPSKVGLILPGYSWTLTREYIPLRAGKISTSVANIQLNEAEKADIENVLSVVKDAETYAKMPRYLQFANRMQKIKNTEVVTSRKLEKSAQTIELEDGSPAILVQVTERFESIFKVGYVYIAIGTTEKGTAFCQYDYKRGKQVGRPFLYTARKVIKEATHTGKLQQVIVREVQESREVISYTNTDIATPDIPEDLLKEIKSDFVKSTVMQLYAKNRNFTPLLSAEYSPDCIEDVSAYCMTHDMHTDFTGRFLSANSLALLERFESVGFSPDFILNNVDEERGIQNAINYIVSLSDAPYNVDRTLIRALYPLAGKFDPMKLPKCSSAEVLYLMLVYGQALPYLVHVFETLGAQVGNAVEIMPAHMTSDFITDLKKVFQITYPFAGDSVDWAQILDSIIHNSKCVGFSIDKGFYIEFYHYQLRRDYNSVFITDKSDVCWWRATCIDEKVYCDHNTLLRFGIT